MELDWHFHPFLFLFIIFTLHSSLTCSVSDSEALLRLKKSFTNASALSSWISGSVPCNRQTHWNGLLCFNGIVTGLQLENMGLSGTIDVDALATIQGIRSLSFARNSFTGAIPELNRLGNLKAIYLRGNQFSGEIPSDFFSKMKSLKKVWLSDNKFTGGIPPSLAELPRLSELHLENNQFSGTIPSIDQPTLMSFNVSNNMLEGEIPPNLAIFNYSSFDGNDHLCGDRVGRGCENTMQTSSESPAGVGLDADMMVSKDRGHNNNNVTKTVAGAVTLAVLLLSITAMIIFRMRRRDKDFDVIENRSNGNAAAAAAPEVQVSLSNRPKGVDAIKKMGSNRKGSINGRGGVGELVIVNNEKGVFGLPDLMKASAEVLGNGGMGSLYKAQMANGVMVVVKRTREMNTLSKDQFDAEIRKLGRLNHTNILTPLAFLYRPDEKLLVYEYMPKGSLLYLLHGDRGTSHAELNWFVRLKIVQGIARGLGYLHTKLASSPLPHGNLKSSNVFLSNDNEPLLSEFGHGPLVSPPMLAQALFGYKAPEAAQYGVSPMCDVYCLGIIVLEILTGKFPSQYLNKAKGGTDVVQWMESAVSDGRETDLLDPEIASSTNSLGQMRQLLGIGAACVKRNPQQRLDITDAIQMIQGIKLEDSNHEGRTMQVLPSLRDGYADAPQTSVSDIQEVDGESPWRRHGSGSFMDHFSFPAPI
ncbi:pollen receptor-like kinase 3 [Populus alba]|uniref:Putative inactive leucine-rich repeat receptor-like protein kinase n=1 Tax=Populus alba TaxID=43335 RepID=A0A4U5P7C7_POPAL|nr:pollen receptor-like kinase 3 [Populus alba]TKR91950.1 putative inactive leucine-rich repeat receptor-like protein kinase [Populus alba]